MVDAALGTTVTVDAILDGPTEHHHRRPAPSRARSPRCAGTACRICGPACAVTCTPTSRWWCRRGSTTQDIELLRKLKENRRRRRGRGEVDPRRRRRWRAVQPAARNVHRPLSSGVSRARCSMSTRCPRSANSPSSTATKVSTPPPCGGSGPASNSTSATAPARGALCRRGRRQGPADGAGAGRAGRAAADAAGHRRAGAAQVAIAPSWPSNWPPRPGPTTFVAWQAVAVRGPLGSAGAGSTRGCAAGARWRARPPGSRGARTSRRSRRGVHRRVGPPGARRRRAVRCWCCTSPPPQR